MAKAPANQFIPTSPVNTSFRPLGGVHRELAGEAIPPGAFYDLKNLAATKRGPTKRGAFEIYSGGVKINSTSTPIYDLGVVWKSSGDQFGALLTSKYLYLVGQANLTPVYWPYSSGVVKVVSGSLVVFSKSVAKSSTAFTTPTTYLTLGDVFVFSNKVVGISAIPTKSTLTIASTIGAYTGAGNYVIRRVFHPHSDTLLDWASIDQKIVITDKKRKGMYAYNGATLGVYSPTMASQGYAPSAVTYFKDRIWTLNSMEKEAGGVADKRHRLRWSGVTADPRTFTASDYLDLPYNPGQGRRILPLGNLLIAYFEDSIWYGVPSNIIDIPYKFDKVETGGIGLVGSRAVMSFLGGHFFVGQDNIYFLPSDPRGGPVPIGDEIAEDTILTCDDPRGVYVVTDPKHQRILFGFPMIGGSIDEIWAYNYISKTWGRLDYEATMLANPLVQLGLTWSDLSGTWTALGGTYPSWNAMGLTSRSARDVFVGNGQQLHRLGDGTTDVNAGVVPTAFETGDIDLGYPDDDKTITSLRLKLRDRPSASTSFLTLGSEDGGNSWRNLGTLSIPTTKREGSVDFGITGSAIRFRLSSSSITESYVISEYGIRVRARGREQVND